MSNPINIPAANGYHANGHSTNGHAAPHSEARSTVPMEAPHFHPTFAQPPQDSGQPQAPAPKEFSKVAAPQARLYRLADALGEALSDAEAAHQARVSGTPRGPITGLSTLDRELSHCLAPGVHGIHGNAGAGKTAFALQVAAACRCPALYVTCEMSPAELLRRHTARATSTFLGRLKSGELAPKDAEKLMREAIAAAPGLHLLDATRGMAAPAFILESARIVKGDAAHLLVVVDSLHSWAEGVGDGTGASEYETLNAAVRELRTLAHALKCPILFIAERNRDSMKSGGLNAGAGTRKIEYGAETVIDLERDMKAEADGAGEVEVILRLAKNRHGAAGREISLSFNGALQRFQETKESDKAAKSR